LAKQGSSAIPQIAPYLSDPDIDVRIETVKALDDLDTQYSLDPLVKALGDVDPEVQIRATDGLVNFYLPGYLRTGFSASLRRAGNVIKGKFTDTNDQVVDPYVNVRPDIIAGLGKVAAGGASTTARANAARATGILRGKAAVPDLIQALHSKDDEVMYETLIALQKIRDPSAGVQISFLLRDLSEKIQLTALETTGLLGNKEALPQLRDAFDRARTIKVKRAALEAIAMMPDESLRGFLAAYLNDKDEALRGSAAEGLGRLKNPASQAALEAAFKAETKTNPRLSQAFALVELGNRDMSELAPLRYLVNTLNSVAYRGVARPYLIELARDTQVRQALYPALQQATKDEKIALAQVFAASGDSDSLPYLETFSKDPDPAVAEEGVRSLRNLRARLH
jgi:HEAT repeat protein